MVQKEISKKTRTYGSIAVLSAMMLVAMIYVYGSTPGITPTGPDQSPNGQPNFETVASMQTFQSYDELRSFLVGNKQTTGTVGDSTAERDASQDAHDLWARPSTPSSAPAPNALSPQYSVGTSSKDYSSTNIQVEGVDEADTVKTDGDYLYVLGNNTVYILSANPQDARVVAKIPFSNAYLSGIYLSQNGDKLAVLGNQYVPISYTYEDKAVPPLAADTDIMIYPYWNYQSAFVYVYDVSNKASPALARNFTMSGSYFNSRMIGDYVYALITESAYVLNNSVVVPRVYSGAEATEIAPDRIYYNNASRINGYDYYTYGYTTFISLNILNDAQAPGNMTIMTDGAGAVYVSQNNIYVTYPVYEWQDLTVPPTGTVGVTPNKAVTSDVSILPVEPSMPSVWRVPSQQKTAIYRVSISGDTLTFAAKGNVTGNVINQYAMDEYNGYFRVATNSYSYDYSTGVATQQSSVHVLNMNLETVGKLEGLGLNENFHAARFMGNRCYLVTFLKTDPLFVIDLSQPSNPRVLGELIIPGYSDYLHPYDETHLIGLGKDAVPTEENFAWYQGLKLSLFDVTDVNNPREMSKFLIGDRGTDSPALYDPKAFLFDKSHNLLVLPVNLYLINDAAQLPETPKPDTSPSTLPVPDRTGSGSSGSSSASIYGQFVWQGVYVFDVTLGDGFVLRGNITQLDNAEALLANPSLMLRGDYTWTEYNHFITRALYIEDILYTFSEARVQLNDLNTLAFISKIELN